MTKTKAWANILKMKNSKESSDLPVEKELEFFDWRSLLLELFLRSSFDLSILPWGKQFGAQVNNNKKRPIRIKVFIFFTIRDYSTIFIP